MSRPRTIPILLAVEDVFAIANVLNQSATRFETMADTSLRTTEATKHVWREQAAEMRMLSRKILAARKRTA